MYTRRRYSVRELLSWTREEMLAFVVVASLPVLAYDVAGWRWLQLPWLPVALIGTAVAFIVSFQNNATYGRLWEARKIWGGITNSSRAWGMMIQDFVSGHFREAPVEEEELAATRRCLVLRHVAWLTALRHAMRQPRPWEDFLRHRTNREWAYKIGVREHAQSLSSELEEYLSEEERARVCPMGNPCTQILALQSEHLRRLREADWIEDFRHMEMQSVLTELVALQGKSERIKNFPYPRQYATLNAAFLWIFILLLPFGVMFEFDKIGLELASQYPALGPRFVWLSVPFSVIVMWVFHTMERIGRVSENPFEGTANDVPITTIARGIEIDLRQMIGEPAASIPPPIEVRSGTQT